MLRILQITALALLLSSCLTDARLKRKAFERGICGVKDSVRIKDSLAIRFRDSIRDVPAKEGPALSLNFGDCNCDSMRKVMSAIQKNPIVKNKNGITETIGSKDGKSIDFSCNEDAYKDTLKGVIQERDFYKFQYENNTKVVYKDAPETWKQVLYRHGFWWILLILVSISIWKSRNLWLHLIFPKI